jgi:hypothetical protein
MNILLNLTVMEGSLNSISQNTDVWLTMRHSHSDKVGCLLGNGISIYREKLFNFSTSIDIQTHSLQDKGQMSCKFDSLNQESQTAGPWPLRRVLIWLQECLKHSSIFCKFSWIVAKPRRNFSSSNRIESLSSAKNF